MFLLLIKKTFFIFWDHIGTILLINLGYFFLCAVWYFFFFFTGITGIVGGFITFVMFFIYTGAVNRITRQLADNSRAGLSDFLPNLKATWLSSLLFSLFALGLFLVLVFFINFLGPVTGLVAYVGFGASFLIGAMSLMTFPYFFAFEAQTNSNFHVNLKKCLLLFLDNPFFSFALLSGGVLLSAVSIFFFLIIPGMGSILLWYTIALRLRLKKYDYLEKNPLANRYQIPWNQILADDIKTLKNRSLKGLLFPWKE